MAWNTFPKKDAYELQRFVDRKEYLRAYMKMKECYKLLHEIRPDKFDKVSLDESIHEVNNAIDTFKYKDPEFKAVYDNFINWCDECRLIIPAKVL